MKPSKWPEQEPAPGESRFEFVLRMALQRRQNDEIASAEQKRARYLKNGYRVPISY